MKKIILGLLALILLTLPALAYDPVGKYYASPPTANDGDATWILTDSNGRPIFAGSVPSSSATVGITPVVSSALESNHIIKASPGNLYGAKITTGAFAGWLLVANSTTAPTAGGAAIAPLSCTAVAANTSTGITFNPPLAASTGITLVFSTTGQCLTNTASATAFFEGYAK